MNQETYEYRVLLSRDEETNQMVAEIPALNISDYGKDTDETLARIREMLVFHLECLLTEGEPIPRDPSDEEGLYIRVRVPSLAH